MNKDRIEDIYSELEGYAKAPPTELWENIESQLISKKKKRRGFLFFLTSVAAVLLVFFGYIIGSSLESNDEPQYEISDKESRIDNDTIVKPEMKITNTDSDVNIVEDTLSNLYDNATRSLQKVVSKNKLSDENEILKKNDKNNSITQNTLQRKEEKNLNNSYKLTFNKENSSLINKENIKVLQLKNKGIISFKNEKATAIINEINQFKNTPIFDLTEELLALEEDSSDSLLLETNNTKWSVEVLGGLSNTVSESSIQDASFNTTAQNDFVYTLKIGYAISDRLTIKSGIGKNILGQKINDVSYINLNTTELDNIPQSIINSQNIINNQSILFLGSQEFFNDASASQLDINKGALQQQLDYIQLPLEVSYSLLNELKYNISLGLGGNVNFLTNNIAYLNDQQIGESLEVSKTVFGATINSNISYKLTKAINLFLEPSYNYFQKPIDNNNQNFTNTQFRALFGLRYSF
ncbi:hypothetical protein [uncultured Winogradskyella sp.]|uniref:hypothetical protein n=1 Tax=uncultured Winogradskyella sp. TaxID=395353 RepID=UPI00260A481F|nr:hypothetical protein [uncultured Winogradskyella sp.]